MECENRDGNMLYILVILFIATLFTGVTAVETSATAAQIKQVNSSPITVKYKNWRGQVAVRTIIPQKIYFGSTEYHMEEQWLLEVWDCDRDAMRVYALKDITQWYVKT